jgi:hypothetical protein
MPTMIAPYLLQRKGRVYFTPSTLEDGAIGDGVYPVYRAKRGYDVAFGDTSSSRKKVAHSFSQNVLPSTQFGRFDFSVCHLLNQPLILSKEF